MWFDLDPSYQLYSHDNEKVIGELELESFPDIQLDEAVIQGLNPILFKNHQI